MQSRHLILLLSLFVQGVVVAQQANILPEMEENTPVQLFMHIPVQVEELPGAIQVASQALHALGKNLNAENLSLSSYRESREGYHYLWLYSFHGIPCEGAYLRVFLDKNLIMRQVLYSLTNLDLLSDANFPATEEARNLASDWKYIQSIRPVYIFQDNTWHACLKMEGVQHLAAHAETWYIDENLEVIKRESNALNYSAPDSMITLTVFNPDPLTTARVPYGGAYQDFNDADSPAINNQRQFIGVPVHFDGDTFRLKDSIIRFAELESPVTFQPLHADTLFNYNRSEDEFEYLNSYYHIHTWIRRVHDLGYPMLPNDTIKVDPHASNGMDVSGFTPSYGGMSLVFGDGGIDDAEDADVLVHELGHALSYSAAPGTTNGLMRTSMEEGNSDYFAMSYSRQLSDYGWHKTFNWDGNVTWQGRTVVTTKFLPQDFSSNKYDNAEIWVAAWKEVYDSLGPDVTDRLVLCGLFNQVGQMTFSQMVANCRQCDSIQNGAANSLFIMNIMNSRGLAFPLGFKQVQNSFWRLINSAGFAFRNEALIVDFADETLNGTAELYDMQGRLIQSYTLHDQRQFMLQGQDIKKGLYLLRIHSDTNLQETFLINRN
ncbi:MAG: T9SS type A sorting domain-containing protein [Bacteroidetes bacterium]|nr:T9SS type A sorting domain-containing protein [Bacteroidota bacterium]